MWRFIKQFITHPKEVGTPLPSTTAFAKHLAKTQDFSKASTIVELGPGNGVLTKEILKNMKKDATLTAIEINKEFCEELKKINDTRLTVINDDAKKLENYVKQTDITLGVIPLAFFTKEEYDNLIAQVKKITKEKFIQIHESSKCESWLKEHFPDVKKERTFNNIPPRIIYTAKL